jgi:hypothetical protein
MPEPPPLRLRRALNSPEYEDTVNRGVHLIHTGGPTDSFLLIPLVRL